MQAQHQNPQEAVEGMMLANAAHAVGHHWGTFQLTNEAVDAPVKALDAALAEKQVDPARFRALRPGEAFDVPPA
jgi:L-ascorbate metabolism protein UlaG (beta-lactamase superfamily)